MGAEELPVAAATEHQVRVEFAAELGAGFGQDAWQVGDAGEFVAEGGQFVAGEPAPAGNAFLDGEKIIAARRRN